MRKLRLISFLPKTVIKNGARVEKLLAHNKIKFPLHVIVLMILIWWN